MSTGICQCSNKNHEIDIQPRCLLVELVPNEPFYIQVTIQPPQLPNNISFIMNLLNEFTYYLTALPSLEQV